MAFWPLIIGNPTGRMIWTLELSPKTIDIIEGKV